MKIKYQKLQKTEIEVDVVICPFCGNDKAKMSGSANHKWLSCLGCGANGPRGADEETAVTSWNTRN